MDCCYCSWWYLLKKAWRKNKHSIVLANSLTLAKYCPPPEIMFHAAANILNKVLFRLQSDGNSKIKLPFVFLHLSGLVMWLVHSKPIRVDNYQCLQSGLPYRIFVVRFPSDWLQCSSLKPNQQCERTKWRKWNNCDWGEARNCVTNEGRSARNCVRQMSLFSGVLVDYAHHALLSIYFSLCRQVLLPKYNSRVIIAILQMDSVCSTVFVLDILPPCR